MIILKSTDTLEVILAAAVATAQPQLLASWVDGPSDESVTQVFRPGGNRTVSNSATAVSLVAAPAANMVRKIEYLSCYNADTLPVILTVRVSGGSTTIIQKVTLAAGERLEYMDKVGFRVIGVTGGVAAGSVASVNGLSGVVVLSMPNDLIVPLGDETTAITTGVKVTLRATRAMSLSAVKASLTAASTSGLPQFDVKKNGVSIFTTKPTINVGSKTTVGATTPSVLTASPISIAADDELTFEIVVAGTGAAGAKVSLVAGS